MKIASQAQQNYLEVLFSDLGFLRKQRNDYLSRECGREIRYLDELSVSEASRIIGMLKENKDDL